MDYYISKKLQSNFDYAVEFIKESLKIEGFGILSEINIHEKLNEKLGINLRKYKILEACNFSYAYEVLQKEDKSGILLLCSVIVQELNPYEIEVVAIDPVALIQLVKKDELIDIAREIRNKLNNAIKSLENRTRSDHYISEYYI